MIGTLPIVPMSIVKTVAGRYIAGPLLEDAVRKTEELMRVGSSSTIDVLGEFVQSRDLAIYEAGMSRSVVDAIHANALDSYLSVKLTSMGVDIDPDFAFENLLAIVSHAHDLGVFVRMDMENTPYTDVTFDFYRRLRADGFDNIGVVIQAYLRRSEADVRALLEYGPSVRLCKGIYVEDTSVAFKNAEDIRTNYKLLLRILMESGADVRVATHDEPLIIDAINLAASLGRAPSSVEFQMLLGVRGDRRAALAKKGYKTRVYVPFGQDWYAYSTRRMKENPAIASHVAKALLTGGR